MYKDGALDGLYEKYSENGHLWESCTYKEGKRNGVYKFFYNNGLLCMKYAYADDKYNGPFEEYYINGQLKEKGTCKDGRLHGLYEVYFNTGDLFYKSWFLAGKKVSKEQYEVAKENVVPENAVGPAKVAFYETMPNASDVNGDKQYE